MPKIIEMTVEIEIQKVSCPGVWLCQDGRVSLTVYALGTSYQTCMLPPVFPLMFNDVFYFRKRFKQSCALNNMCCLLKDETVYCELVQWSEDCVDGPCLLLAQYLGSLNDVLFPSNLCWSDGVDLLMRRSKDFPGILSPKIEISTKVRIDEVWDKCRKMSSNSLTKNSSNSCECIKRTEGDVARQKQVCHTSRYHRNMCHQDLGKAPSSFKLRSRSSGSKSYCGLNPPIREEERTPCNMKMSQESVCLDNCADVSEERLRKILLESRYIEQDNSTNCAPKPRKNNYSPKLCVCEICKRYHELFHSNNAQDS